MYFEPNNPSERLPIAYSYTNDTGNGVNGFTGTHGEGPPSRPSISPPYGPNTSVFESSYGTPVFRYVRGNGRPCNNYGYIRQQNQGYLTSLQEDHNYEATSAMDYYMPVSGSYTSSSSNGLNTSSLSPLYPWMTIVGESVLCWAV